MLREARRKLKFRALARRLGSEALAVGYLEMLWHATAESAPDGAIGRYADADLEAELGWDGESGALVRALIESHWVDEVNGDVRLYVHDWHEHADYSVQRKLARARLRFANGSDPKWSTLTGKEREDAAAFYEARTGRKRKSSSNPRVARGSHQESLQVQVQGVARSSAEQKKEEEPPASPARRVLSVALPAIEEAFGAYDKRPRAWSEARKRALRARASESSPEALAHAVHGYAWMHRSPGNGFDPLAHLTPETIYRPSNFAKYLDAYAEAIAAGQVPPFRIEPRASPGSGGKDALTLWREQEEAKQQ